MKTISLMFFSLLALSSQLLAQPEHDITPLVLNDLQKTLVPDAAFKTAQHALAQVDGNKITQNWEKINSVDPYFSLRLKDLKATDQKGTGRCWMFSGLNVLRPVAANKLGLDDIELSQNYLYF